MDFAKDLALGVLTVLLFIGAGVLIEALVPRDRHSLASKWPGALFNAAMIVGSVLIAYPLGKATSSLGIGPLLPPIHSWAGPLAIPLAVLAQDFLRYWEHRFEHRFMWPVHAVHHSIEELHTANSYGHPLQAVPMFFLVALPFSLLNFASAEIPVVVGLLVGFQLLFIHTSSDFHLGPLRWLLVDNRFHRIHHSVEARHFDRNFANIFSLWDRLFGTAYEPGEEWPKVGLERYAQPRSLRQFLLLPFSRSN